MSFNCFSVWARRFFHSIAVEFLHRVSRGGSTIKILFSSSGIVFGYSNHAGEEQVELKSQRRVWERRTGKL